MLVQSNGNLNEEPKDLWENKIYEAEFLLHLVDGVFEGVEGVGKLKNKLKAEMRFLNSLKGVTTNELGRYLVTSNVTHFRGLIDVAKKYSSCCAFYKKFAGTGERSLKLEVDLVVDGGASWVKVISRNVRGLAMEFIGASGNNNRSIIEQALDYIQLAGIHTHFYEPPRIIFVFVNGVPDILARKLESLGIIVSGSEVAFNELVKMPADFSLDDVADKYEITNEYVLKNKFPETRSCSVDTVNLDVTAVFVLITSLTHENGVNYFYTSRLLNSQAARERITPALPPLLKAIKDKKLIICQTAYNSVQSIISTVAGPEEKLRAQKLFEKVQLVEDKMSERAAKLKMSDKINERSKIIFGSGDYYKAATATANRHFLHAAAHQGLHFVVILHESRALSEQKQRLQS